MKKDLQLMLRYFNYSTVSKGSGNNGNTQDAILTKRKHKSEPFSKRVRSKTTHDLIKSPDQN